MEKNFTAFILKKRYLQLGTTPINTYDAFNLHPGGEYKFRITPRSRYGWGESTTTEKTFIVGEMIDLPEFSRHLPRQMIIQEGSTLKLECTVSFGYYMN